MMFALFTPTLVGSRLNLPLGNSSKPPGTSPALYGTRTGSRHDPKTLAVEAVCSDDGDAALDAEARAPDAWVGVAPVDRVAEPHAAPNTHRRTTMLVVARTGKIVCIKPC